MNQLETMLINDEQNRNNLLKLSAESRRLREAFPSDNPKKVRRQSRFLVEIRKELLNLRFSLEWRISQVRDLHLGFSPQNDPERCD